MSFNEQIDKDLETLGIDIAKNITTRYVTSKYKKLARERHPDKQGGSNEAFQELQNAYRRVIKHLEHKHMNESVQEDDEDFETQFFKKHNFMKKCTTSFVVYIEDKFVEHWKKVMERHLSVHKIDK